MQWCSTAATTLVSNVHFLLCHWQGSEKSISKYSFSHNHGSGKWPFWRFNSSSRALFSMSMIMGGRVWDLLKFSSHQVAANNASNVPIVFDLKARIKATNIAFCWWPTNKTYISRYVTNPEVVYKIPTTENKYLQYIHLHCEGWCFNMAKLLGVNQQKHD